MAKIPSMAEIQAVAKQAAEFQPETLATPMPVKKGWKWWQLLSIAAVIVIIILLVYYHFKSPSAPADSGGGGPVSAVTGLLAGGVGAAVTGIQDVAAVAKKPILTAVAAVDTTGKQAVGAVSTAGKQAVAAVSTTGQKAVTAVGSGGQKAVTVVSTSGQKAVTAVGSGGQKAVTVIQKAIPPPAVTAQKINTGLKSAGSALKKAFHF